MAAMRAAMMAAMLVIVAAAVKRMVPMLVAKCFTVDSFATEDTCTCCAIDVLDN